jgi:hypothetical protein
MSHFVSFLEKLVESHARGNPFDRFSLLPPLYTIPHFNPLILYGDSVRAKKVPLVILPEAII